MSRKKKISPPRASVSVWLGAENHAGMCSDVE